MMKQILSTLLFVSLSIVSSNACAQEAPPAAMQTGVLVAEKQNASILENGEADWDLCPQPSEALTSVPPSAEQLQADIDRYTLCLDRAQLLIQLEELSKTGSEETGAMALPLEGTPTPLTPEQTNDLLAGGAAAPEPVEEKPLATIIRDIRGIGGKLMAQLVTPEGDIETVSEGDTLSNGAEVAVVTATQVSIRKDGKLERLEWEN